MAGVAPTASVPTGASVPLPTPPMGGGTFPSVSFASDFVKLRFFEPDVPFAINQRWLGMPRGVYLGFIPSTTPSSRVLTLDVDPNQNFSLLKVPSGTERVMVDIFTNESVELDFSAHTVWPVYVVATSTYNRMAPVQGKIFTRATPANDIDEVTICKVNKSGADLVVESDAPTNREPPLAFQGQDYGYMPDSSVENLATTTATVAEVIAARNSSYTGGHSSLSDRIAADMSGSAMADRLGLRLTHLLSNIHPNRTGSSFNVSSSFAATGRVFGPNLTIAPGGSEVVEGALTSGARNECFVVNATTGERLVNTTREPVFGRISFTSGSLGGGVEIQFVNASTSVNGGGTNPFQAPLQEGDLVQGPDGLFYEVEEFVDPDNAVLGAAFQGTSGSAFGAAYRRWLLFLFTVSGGPFALPGSTPIQFLFPGFFRMDRAVFDGTLYLKRNGERPQLPVATTAIPGKALLAIDNGLVGSFRIIKNAGAVAGNDIHTLNFAFGGATNAGGGVANVAVPGAPGAAGPGSNQGPDGPTGEAGFGYSLNNAYDVGPETGTTGAAVGPVSVTHTTNWTTTAPNFSVEVPRSYAHVTGGWNTIDGFQFFGFELVSITEIAPVDGNSTRITYRIDPLPNTSITTVAAFQGACQ